jgi:hypothetical protein
MSFLFDDMRHGDGDGDVDGDGDGDIIDEIDESILDTSWIQDIENDILYDEYCNFIIEDITSIPITFLYMNKKKEIVHSVRCDAKLKIPNQISQDEILYIMQKYQIRRGISSNKNSIMYYNFYSMIHYSFYVKEDPKSISYYLLEDDSDADSDADADTDVYKKNVASSSSSSCEYSNIISIHTLYFKPVLRLFNDISSLTILLIED